MTSPIYKIQDRGEVVYNACQWLWEHRRLAFRIMVLPTLICAVVLGMNIAFIDNWFIYLLLVLYALLLLPVMPCLMFHVVENPEESGYPERMPKLKVILRPWWRYFFQMLVVSIISGIAMFLASFTFIGGIFVAPLVPLAIVIGQRDEDAGAGAILAAFKMVRGSFGNFCMTTLGNVIISMSMTFAPMMMVYGVGLFLEEFVPGSVTNSMRHIFGTNLTETIAIFATMLGMIFSMQIVTVVNHFFYGHCIEKDSHPALIERMEQFDEE